MPNNPFSFFQLPWSGPVTQDLLDHWFSPAVTYNFAGNATIEKQVVRDPVEAYAEDYVAIDLDDEDRAGGDL